VDGGFVALPDPPGDGGFLRGREQRGPADFLEIEIQDVAFRVEYAERGGGIALPVPRLAHGW
jgi:hypothetical protein